MRIEKEIMKIGFLLILGMGFAPMLGYGGSQCTRSTQTSSGISIEQMKVMRGGSCNSCLGTYDCTRSPNPTCPEQKEICNSINNPCVGDWQGAPKQVGACKYAADPAKWCNDDGLKGCGEILGCSCVGGGFSCFERSYLPAHWTMMVPEVTGGMWCE